MLESHSDNSPSDKPRVVSVFQMSNLLMEEPTDLRHQSRVSWAMISERRPVPSSRVDISNCKVLRSRQAQRTDLK